MRPRGIALISAMLIATFATAAAVAILKRQHTEIRRTANVTTADRAGQRLAAIEALALETVRLDASRSQINDFSEGWATRSFEASDASGSIEDLQARFNLTNLSPFYGSSQPGNGDRADGKSARERLAEMRFRLLLNALEIDTSIVQAILDWTDADSATRFPNGAEDDYYLGTDQPYRAANRPLVSARELLLVRGVSQDIFERLEPFVVALSEPTPVNINTAPLEVLMSVAPGIDRALAAMLIRVREVQPFISVQSFMNHQLLLGLPVRATEFAVSSRWFALNAVIRVDTLRFRSSTTLYRHGGRARVRSRRHGYFDG